MAEATINLKLSPREFDLIREAVRDAHTNSSWVSTDKNSDVKLRSLARQRTVEYDALIGKLN